MALYRETVQVFDNFDEFKNINLHENVGCESLTVTQRTIFNKPDEEEKLSGGDDILLELAT